VHGVEKLLTKETYYRVQRELPVFKETYYCVKRAKLQSQKSPAVASKVTCYSVTRDLRWRGDGMDRHMRIQLVWGGELVSMGARVRVRMRSWARVPVRAPS
jgi:hypothetical protein